MLNKNTLVYENVYRRGGWGALCHLYDDIAVVSLNKIVIDIYIYITYTRPK